MILGALVIVGLAMLGFVVASLLRGPDYQNDDYVAPPPGNVKPLPNAPLSELDALLTANELYAQQVPAPVRCELRNPNMNLETASDAEVKDYIDDLMACNMRVWDPAVLATNRWELVRPAVNIYDTTATTPCGGGRSMGPNASYCLANQEVYFSRQLHRAHPNLAGVIQPNMIDAVMAHEFGHAIQGRSLILIGSVVKGRQGDTAAQLEQSRRVEVQADCFTGMWVASVAESRGYSQTDADRMVELFRRIGDDGLSDDPDVVGNHGRGDSREYWFRLGYNGTDVGRCNTFTVGPEYVR